MCSGSAEDIHKADSSFIKDDKARLSATLKWSIKKVFLGIYKT
jgi:hypothetical protein